MGHISLQDEVRYLKGVGPARAEALRRLGVETVEDLLRLRPRRFFDRTDITQMVSLKEGETATVVGRVERVEMGGGRGGKTVVRALLTDGTANLQLIWFNQPYILSRIKVGTILTATGKVRLHPYYGLQMSPREWEIFGDTEQSLLPVYPLTEGISQRQMRRIVSTALASVTLEEYLPGWLLMRRLLPSIGVVYKMLHFPETYGQFEEALRRLKYEELFLLQLGALARRRFLAQHTAAPLKVSSKLHKHILDRFPFQLTNAQKRAIEQITLDLTSTRPMHRLLQGDVGSGKTVVALYAMLVAVGNHKQAALMAPTEILAEQHFLFVKELLHNSRVRLGLLTSSTPKRSQTLKALKGGEIDLIIGTHALLTEAVAFPNLAVVVIDEQHRFGVAQRALLLEKAQVPHLLVMTATPIPRSLALTLFGDTDVSVLDEMPPGRARIETQLFSMDEIMTAVERVKEAVERGECVFIVCPAIESGEGWRGVIDAHRWWSEQLSPRLVGMLHGRMGQKEREESMAAFRKREKPVLVATTVIEVGIDVPDATVMVIENAERYGLAQLHQLRGRIGRGGKTGLCLLLYGKLKDEARKRLEIITKTTDGFKIAIEDLRIRGTGEFFGTKQTGIPDLSFADMEKDIELLYQAREDAEEFLSKEIPSSTRSWLRRRLGPFWRLLVS